MGGSLLWSAEEGGTAIPMGFRVWCGTGTVVSNLEKSWWGRGGGQGLGTCMEGLHVRVGFRVQECTTQRLPCFSRVTMVLHPVRHKPKTLNPKPYCHRLMGLLTYSSWRGMMPSPDPPTPQPPQPPKHAHANLWFSLMSLGR